MAVDIDEYLSQTEVGFAQDSLNDMNNYGQNRFGHGSFGFYDSYGNNLSMDPFSNDNLSPDPFSSNNGTGGQGSLSFQQHLAAPSDLDGHSFSHNSEPAFGHQASPPSGLDGHSSSPNSRYNHEHPHLPVPASHNDHAFHHDAEQCHDPSAMLIDGEFEDVPDSIEHGQNSREEEIEEDEVPLKNEEHDSDGDFKEEDGEDEPAEEDQNDEEDNGGRKKKKKEKHKPYKHSRILTRWDTSVDQLALLVLIHILEREGVEIPYKELNLHVNGGANWDDKEGGPVGQHLTKVRKARIYFGMPVPPPKKSARNSTTVDLPKNPTEKETKTFHSLTYTRPGREDKMDGIPGQLQARYTPVPIPDRPDLPIYDATHSPPMWPLPEGFQYLKYEIKSKALGTVPTSDKKQGKLAKSSVEQKEDVPVTSTEKKRRSTKKVVKAEDDDDTQYSAKPARKAQNPLAASKRKTAAQRALESTPAKLKGVPKSKKTPATQKKTPATVTKKLTALVVDSAGKVLESADTPSKRTGGIKPTPKVNAAAEHEPLPAEVGSTTINEAQPPVQNYGRVNNMDATSMLAQTFGDMHAGLPPNRFQMGKHRASRSFESQSTMSTVDGLPQQNTPAQFMPVRSNQLQHNYAGSGYGHQMMPPHGPSFAHGHGMQDMSKEELIQKILRDEQAATRRMHQYNSSRRQANMQAHGHGPHGLGIVNAPAMMPREHAQFDTEMGDYGFASGPASNVPSQQQFFNNFGQMQNDCNNFSEMQNLGNDSKPNMDQYSGIFNDMSDLDPSVFDDNHQ